jgi:hypothetical protein
MVSQGKQPDFKAQKELSSEDEVLLDEFLSVLAAIATRLLTKDSTERDNGRTLGRGEGK